MTWRILAVNLLALGVLFAGFVYLDAYRRSLLAAELATLESKAKLFAAAIAESATSPDVTAIPGLIAPLAQQMVRRLVEASKLRARLFNGDGSLVADSLVLLGPGGLVQIEQLPPPRTKSDAIRICSTPTTSSSRASGSRRLCRPTSSPPCRAPRITKRLSPRWPANPIRWSVPARMAPRS